jgi:hypothetical protein
MEVSFLKNFIFFNYCIIFLIFSFEMLLDFQCSDLKFLSFIAIIGFCIQLIFFKFRSSGTELEKAEIERKRQFLWQIHKI